MKKFVMSKYATLEHLMVAKSNYYEALSKQLLDFLSTTGDVNKIDGVYYWDFNGEPVGWDIPSGNIEA